MTVSNELWKDLPEEGSPMIEYALCYANHGIPVFPVKPYTKTGYYCYPEFKGSPSQKYPDGTPYSWKSQATTDPDIIRRFWADHPDANIAGATGNGLYILDLDPEHVNRDSSGRETLITDGWDRLRQWQRETGMKLNTETAMSLTGRGGNQIFYHADPKQQLNGRSDIFNDGSGCDTRGDGNYVMLPPSIHPNGERYTWEQPPDEYPIIEADEAFFRYWNGTSGKTGSETKDLFDPYVKVTNNRHEYLKRYIGWMIKQFPDLTRTQYENMLRKKNSEDIFPSLGDNADDHPDELERTMFPFIPKIMIKDGERKKEQTRQAEQIDDARNDDAYWNFLLSNAPVQTPTMQIDDNQPDDKTREIEKNKFHRWSTPAKDGSCKPLDILDLLIADDIIRSNNVFLLHGKLYLYEDGVYRNDSNDLIFKEIAKKYIYPELVTDQRLKRIVNLLKSDRSISIEDRQTNMYPKHWICFKNGFLDLKTMEMHPHNPKYNNTAMIPHDWDPDHNPYGSITETFLKDFIKDPDDLEMFLEFSGLSMTTDMHFQKMLILRGEGGLGKSVLLRMLDCMIGEENEAHLPLQNLNTRFDPLFLYGKILNSYGDLSSEDMQTTAGMKTITGEDTVRGEIKGGDVIFFKPICKCIFSANRIPKSKDDKTAAYYRRLLIIPFNQRAEYIEGLEEKLHDDIASFITLSVQAGHRMYAHGSILESENSKREVQALYLATDTVMAYITDCCEVGKDCKCSRDQLYSMYEMYCEREGRPSLSRQGFYQNLREKGFSERFLDGYKWFHGLRFIQDRRS